MKIALLDVGATTSYGGVQTGVWNFAREFDRLGHDVTVIGGDGAITNPFPGKVRTLTFPFTPRARFPRLGLRFPVQKFAERFSFAMRRGPREALRREQFDWVILHKPLDFFWPWLPGIPGRTRFAFMSGGADFLPFDRRLVRRIRALFACSAFNAWQLFEHFHRMPRVTYYGVDLERFAPRSDRDRFRAQWGLGDREIAFGFAGRLVDWKGVAYAVRAMAHEAVSKLPSRFMIAGEGPIRGELEAMVSALGLQNRVTFVGALKHAEVANFYAACDIGVFPSVADEAFGITIAEAMSCGLPVVGSYIGGIPEVIGNEGRCGTLVPPGDAAALAIELGRLGEDPARREACGRHARRRVLDRFTWPRAASTLLGELRRFDTVRAAPFATTKPLPAAPAENALV